MKLIHSPKAFLSINSQKPTVGILIFALLFSYNFLSAQNVTTKTIWNDITKTQLSAISERVTFPTQFRTLKLNATELKRQLSAAPIEPATTAKLSNGLVLSLPLPDGSFQRFQVFEYAVMQPELAAQFPEIKTYTGQGIDDAAATLKIDFTPHGFHALVLSEKGTYIIDPYSKNNILDYICYDRKYASRTSAFECETEGNDLMKQNLGTNFNVLRTSGANLRTYRLALACTGEYATFHGGTVPLALAAMVTSMNRVNGVYEKEVAIRLVMVANNNLLVYTNSATDPYTNNSGGTMLTENQNNITTVIGSANYDMGHVFSTGGGGVAGLGVICSAGNKARGVTGTNAPIGDNFDIDYVAHEMGHQFGGNHTFNSVTGSCNGNRAASAAYEPGSGITIQAYAGICGSDNLAAHSIPYFSTKSFDEMVIFSTTAGGNSCPVTTATGNIAPVVSNMGANKSIPISTPFILTGAGTDADSDPLTFSWEQFDLGTGGAWNANLASAPLFRPFTPSTSPSRTFPQISDIVANTSTVGEILPNVARTMHFRLTVRDNKSGGGGVMHPDTTVSINVVNNGGAFEVTAPNTSVSWSGASTQTVTWNVSGTTSAPINTANVTILLSTDGGFTYPTTIVSNTPNDGSESITVPNIVTSTARIKVEAVGNIFFDISNTNFTITAPLIPDYTIVATPPSQNVCINSNAVYTISTSSILGYSGAITLAATGLPIGASALFSPNPVTPGNNSTLTISALTQSGSATISINATSASANKSTSVGLTVLSAVGAFVLTAPANNSTGQLTNPIFSWGASSDASSYDLEIATNALFTTGLQTFTGIAGTSYTPLVALNPITVYFWRVRSVNQCATGNYTSAFSFTTGNIICTLFTSTNVPLAISASGTPTITSNLVIPTAGTITDVNLVNVTGLHSWINDLTFTLKSPGAINDIVMQNICADQDNFNVNFDDEASNLYASLPCPPTSGLFYNPKNALSIYDGTALLGTWQLLVNDLADQDGGSLDSWGLNVCYIPICNLTATLTPVNETCPAACNGTASVVLNNGTSPYAYNWSNGQSSASASALCATTYSLTVTDGAGCIATQNFSVGTSGSLPAQPGAFSSSSAVVCAGATGIVYTIPAVGGVSYAWSYSGSGATINGAGNSILVDFSLGATAGNLTVTPSNSCGNGPVLQLGISITNPVNWYLDADGDGYYTIGPVLACTSPGIGYNTTATQSGDCNDADNLVHQLPAASVISASGSLNFCTGGSVTLSGNTASGEWSNLETTPSIAVTSSGNYFVSNSNTCGSVNSNTITVTVSAAALTPFSVTQASPYLYGFENASPPALFCGMGINNDNFPADEEQWHTSTASPHSGNNHMAIDANSDGVSVKEDWFFTAPLNLQAGKAYRILFWYKGTNAAKTEKFSVFVGNTPYSYDMLTGASIYAKNTVQNTNYVLDSTEFTAAFTGTYYFGFYARSLATMASLYVDDISVKETTTSNLIPTFCTTQSSLYNQLLVVPVPGATNYEYHIVSTTPGENYDYRVLRNNGNPDYRLKWAPGVTYGISYNISVKYFKNGVWSAEGAVCPITLGAFPQIKLRDNPLTPGLCNYTISDLNTLIRTDSVSGANDYQYKIMEEFPGVGYDYNQDWQRGNSNIDFRLNWASSSTVDRVRFGYRYAVQSKALVGKTTTAAFGNRPGTWGTYGTSCMLDLLAAAPVTSLLNCATVLTNLGDAIFINPISGASDYRYHITAPGYNVTVYRGNSNTDYRLTWIAATGNQGVKYGTTYTVEVSAKVGGVYLNYGSVCSVTTPIAPSTSLLGVCSTILSPGQFSSQLFCTAIAGASNYAYRISGAFTNGGTQRIIYRNTSANDFKFSWTLQASNLPNMKANTTYTVEVAYQAGGQWEAYGAPCTITTGATVPRYSPFESDELELESTQFSLAVYPNPAALNEQISYELQGIRAAGDKVELTIHSILGTIVYSTDVLTSDEPTLIIKPTVILAKGIYLAEARVSGKLYRQKFIVN